MVIADICGCNTDPVEKKHEAGQGAQQALVLRRAHAIPEGAPIRRQVIGLTMALRDDAAGDHGAARVADDILPCLGADTNGRRGDTRQTGLLSGWGLPDIGLTH